MSRGNAQVEKVVVKTAVRTVLAILAVLIVAFAVASFGFPQYMASVCENLGNYSLALRYSALRYSYTDDSLDLARCFENSVSLGDPDSIIKYGEELVAKSDFTDVCHYQEAEFGKLSDIYLDGESLGFDYEQRVKGKIATAYYLNGDAARAADYALEANGTQSFRSGNALIQLYAAVKTAGDGAAAQLLADRLSAVVPSDGEESDLLAEVKISLQAVVSGNKG